MTCKNASSTDSVIQNGAVTIPQTTFALKEIFTKCLLIIKRNKNIKKRMQLENDDDNSPLETMKAV